MKWGVHGYQGCAVGQGELSVVEVVGIVVYQGCGVVKGRVPLGVELSGERGCQGCGAGQGVLPRVWSWAGWVTRGVKLGRVGNLGYGVGQGV